jgi:hypothetical protein
MYLPYRPYFYHFVLSYGVVGCATSHFAGVLHKAMDALANAKMYEVGSKRSRKFCLWSARPRCFVHLGSCDFEQAEAGVEIGTVASPI